MPRIDSLNIINETIQRLGHRTLVRDEQQLQRSRRRLGALSDEDVRRHCLALLAGTADEPPASPLSRLFRALRRLVSGSALEAADVRSLAYAVEAFRRAPADLGPGAQLYREQEQAAIALLQNTVIQMDTGEGKTYALLPAAFTLATRYANVYILCANEYLARRDAARTRRYWEFVGITPGTADDKCDPREWSRRVIYTTMSRLLFKFMGDQMSMTVPGYPVTLGAVLLDDADVMLLDEAVEHHLTHTVAAAAFDWDFAFTFCDSLTPDDTITVIDDEATPRATLTVKGEDALRAAMGPPAGQGAKYLLTRHTVELAFLAKHVLREGDHYVVQADGVFPLSRVDGRIRRDWSPSWLQALQAARGLPAQSKPIVAHRMRPAVLLKRFAVHSGVSGTVSSDALEYLFGYLMRAVRIAPKFRRHQGESDDIYFPGKPGAVEYAVDKAREAVAQGRPVLVGTHTIPEAQHCHELLSQQLAGKARVSLLTGQNEEREAHLFETAGQVGSVMVATQVAGRGVDIRLSEQARANGGLVLIGLGRAQQARHDRQFLGRAGRQGDPFDSCFVCSLDDSSFEGYRVGMVKAVQQLLNIPYNVPLAQGGLVEATFRRAQRDRRWRQLRNRRMDLVLDVVDGDVGNALQEWVQRSQRVADGDSAACSPQFVSFAVERFLETNVRSMVNSGRPLGEQQADQLAEAISAIVGYNPHVATRHQLKLNLVGRDSEQVRETATHTLTAAIRTASEINARRIERFGDLAEAEHNATSQVNDWRIALRRTAAIFQVLSERIAECEQAEAEQRPAIAATDGGDQTAAVDGDTEPVSADGDTGAVDAVAAQPARHDAELAVRADGELLTRPDTELAVVRGVGVAARLRAQPSVNLDDLEAAADEALLLEDLRGIEKLAVQMRQSLIKGHDDAQRRASSGAAQAWSKIRERSPRRTAGWTMDAARVQFIKERELIKETLRRSNLPVLQYLRVLNDRILEQWQRCEAEMSREVLTNLAHSWHPDGMDAVFAVADNIVTVDTKPRRSVQDWQVSASDVPASPHRHSDELVLVFVRRVDTTLTDSERAHLLRILKDFLAGAPLTMLQTSEQIAKRMLDWQTEQRQRQVPTRLIRADLDWVGKFLGFLRDRGAIGELPTVRVRAKAVFGRLVRNLAEYRTVLPLLGALAFAAVFAMLSTVTPGRQLDLPPLATLADALMSGGLLSAGALTGPIAAALVAQAVGLAMLHSHCDCQLGPAVRLNFAIPPLLAFIAVTVSWPWGHVLSTEMLVAVLLAVGIALLFMFTASVTFQLELWANLELLPVWICGTTSLVFLPELIRLGDARPALVQASFAVLVLAYVCVQQLNRAHLRVRFRHMPNLETLKDSELAVSEYAIAGSPGIRAHGVGLGLAVSTLLAADLGSQALADRPLDTVAAAVLSIAAYLAGLAIWTVLTINRRCAPAAWSRKLNSMSQILDPAYGQRLLPAVLTTARRRLLTVELSVQTTLVVACCAVLWGHRIAPSTLPLGLLVAFGAAVLAELGRRVLRQLYSLLFLRTAAVPAAIDLPTVDEEDEDETGRRGSTMWRTLRRRAAKTLGGAIAIVTLCAALVDTATIWELINKWFD